MTTNRLLVGAVFLVGCAVGGASSQLVVPKASAQQAATLTRWEYTCFAEMYSEDIVVRANELGADFWELAAAGDKRVCFKRPTTQSRPAKPRRPPPPSTTDP